jgi:hypothetical protein
MTVAKPFRDRRDEMQKLSLELIGKFIIKIRPSKAIGK